MRFRKVWLKIPLVFDTFVVNVVQTSALCRWFGHPIDLSLVEVYVAKEEKDAESYVVIVSVIKDEVGSRHKVDVNEDNVEYYI